MPTETLTTSTAEIENLIDIAVNEALKALKSLPHHDNDKADKLAFKEAVNKVVSLGAINKTIEENNTLLHLAIKQSSLFAVKRLLARAADMSLQNEAGDNTLHLAVKLGHFVIVEEMLGLSAAAKFRKTKSTWTHKDRNQKLNDLENSQKKVRDLLNKSNQQNETPLIIAAKLQDDRIYKRLQVSTPLLHTKKAC